MLYTTKNIQSCVDLDRAIKELQKEVGDKNKRIKETVCDIIEQIMVRIQNGDIKVFRPSSEYTYFLDKENKVGVVINKGKVYLCKDAASKPMLNITTYFNRKDLERIYKETPEFDRDLLDEVFVKEIFR